MKIMQYKIQLIESFPYPSISTVPFGQTPVRLYWPFIAKSVDFLTAFPSASLPRPLCTSTLKGFFPHRSVPLSLSIDVWLHFCRPSARQHLALLHSSVLPSTVVVDQTNLRFCAKCTKMPLGHCTAPIFCIGARPKKYFLAPTAALKLKF